MTTKTENKLLSREEILAAQDIPCELVEVPEWGGSVWVRGLTGRDRDRFEASLLQGKGNRREVNLDNLRTKLVVASVTADNNGGGRLFMDDDIPALSKKSAAALNRVFEVAQRLSGLTPGQVEELTESLGEDQSGDSGSG